MKLVIKICSVIMMFCITIPSQAFVTGQVLQASEDVTEQYLKGVEKLWGKMLTEVINSQRKPCVDQDGVGIQNPLVYTAATKTLQIVAAQKSMRTSRYYDFGQDAMLNDPNVYNDAGVAQCQWLFVVFNNNTSTTKWGTSTTLDADTVSRIPSELSQTVHILDFTRDAAGNLVDVEFASIYTTMINSRNATDSNSEHYASANIDSGAKRVEAAASSGMYVATPGSNGSDDIFNKTKQLSSTAVIANSTPVFMCMNKGATSGQTDIVHGTSPHSSSKLATGYPASASACP